MDPRITRRDFLAYGGATAAGITLGEAGRRWLARADERAGRWQTPALETWTTSVCRECAAGCGVRVRLMDQTPVKLEGNPLCPIARGRLCAKGQAAIESYFDPDRLVGPARRAGARGEARWTPIGWEEAVRALADGVSRARANATPILALAAEERGPLADAWRGFWTDAGGRVAWTLAPTAVRLSPRFAALTGAIGAPFFDLERATHVLSFGAPIVEDWLSPLWAQRSYGRFRRGRGRPRGRLVQIEGRRSLTARKADEWVPLAADRQAFLAYGIASVLIRENRIDRAFLDTAAGNLEAFEREVITRYTPDDVAVATGIPVVTLLRLARELASTSQPLIVTAADASADLADAVFALNALVGALDRPGGVFETPAPRPKDEPPSAQAALEELAAGRGRCGVLALRDASALRAVAAPHELAAVLDRCDLVVSFSPYLDEASASADLLLPAHTPLESWHVIVPPPADPGDRVACAAPAARPRLETRDVMVTLRAAAEALGTAASLPWKSSADLVHAEVARLWSLRRGVPYTGVFEVEWVRQLEKGGWWVPPAASADDFAQATLRAGGWVDPFFVPGGVRDALAARGGLRFAPPAATMSVSARAGEASLPIAPVSFDRPLDTPARPPREFPLHLVVFTPPSVNLVGGPNQPLLFELLGQPDGAAWRVWAEMNGETAHEAGVAHGDTVRITSAGGSIDALAVVVERMPDATVAVAYVPAIASGGRWARYVSADVRQLARGADGPVAVRMARL